MTPLPVETKTAMAVLNLPEEPKTIAIAQAHAPAVMLHLKRFCDPKAWYDVQEGQAEPDTIKLFEFAYCYLLLADVAEFLNLKTIGSGIIKTTGIDSQQTALLSGSEVTNFKNQLTLKALTTVEDYLNQRGRNRFYELREGRIKRHSTTRVAVI